MCVCGNPRIKPWTMRYVFCLDKKLQNTVAHFFGPLCFLDHPRIILERYVASWAKLSMRATRRRGFGVIARWVYLGLIV